MKKRDKKSSPGIFTRAVHSGEGRRKYADSLITPVVQTSTFVFHDTKDIHDYTSKKKVRFEYGRYGNPTQRAVEMKLAELEGAEDCQVFSSGMIAGMFLYGFVGGFRQWRRADAKKHDRQFTGFSGGR